MVGSSRRRRARGRWVIAPVPGYTGLFSVLRNGRQILAAVPEEAARAAVRRGRADNDRVVLVEADGYENVLKAV